MAVSKLAYNIIIKAIKIRLDRGEGTVDELVDSYTKLSDDQKKQAKAELATYVPAAQEKEE